MNNKFNLNYFEAMENANEYLDMLEDNMTTIKNELQDNPDELNKILSLMKEDTETILQLSDMLYFHLEQNDYQNVCNQLVINDMFNIFIKDSLPEGDLEYLSEFLENISEQQLIDYATKFIDRYNEEEVDRV